MRAGGNNFNYFPENKLIKLANFVQFMRICLCFVWRTGGWAPLGYATDHDIFVMFTPSS